MARPNPGQPNRSLRVLTPATPTGAALDAVVLVGAVAIVELHVAIRGAVAQAGGPGQTRRGKLQAASTDEVAGLPDNSSRDAQTNTVGVDANRESPAL